MDRIIFSGTSNTPLALAIAKDLKLPLGDVEITRFIDNECRVYIKENVAGKHVFVSQSLSQVADQHLVELCLIGQALKSLKARHVTAVIPWMGYSKQDKEFRKGEAVSAQLVAKFIESAGFDAVVTCELHSENLLPFFHIPITEISSEELLADVLHNTLREKREITETMENSSRFHSNNKIVVVSPDEGGIGRSTRFAKAVGLPIIYLQKKRDVETGKVAVVDASGDVTHKTIVIFDDIINTGATAIKTSEFLKKHGAGKIYFLATHAVLAGDAYIQLSKSLIDQVIVTDTIIIPREKRFSNLKVVSVAQLLARAIKRLEV